MPATPANAAPDRWTAGKVFTPLAGISVWPETKHALKLHDIGSFLECCSMRWLFSCVLAFWIAVGPAAATEARSTFMWVLRDKGKSIRIVGYPGWTPTGVSPLNIHAVTAIRRSGRIYTDDPATPGAGSVMRMASLMACRAPLSDRLPMDLLAKLRALSAKAGINFEELELSCGWYVVVRFEEKLRSVPGYEEVDIAAAVTAVMELGSNRTELFGLDDILPIIQAVKPEDDAELLRGLVSGLGTLEQYAAGTYDAWIDGDEAAFLEASRPETESDPVNIRVYRLANNLLAEKIAKIAWFSPEDAVVVVNGDNLLGEDGVLARLKKKGFLIYKIGG